ncbi:MAG TPA: hypothetical protein VGP79_07110 [Bryobacteraceae bacterium]|nr:hypothetical protein [Bryobacteraceae bacterium]
MLSLKRVAVALVALAWSAWGQPALTTINDILYSANGQRFTGTLFVSWNSFQAADGSNIASSTITKQIVNGALKIQLTPTTNASAGAQYTVVYNSRGRTQFTEIWAVPTSSVPLRVRDVRIAAGTVIGPEPVTSPVQISDVVGLVNELAVRPMKGVSYSIGRTAIINQAGQIDGAAGNLGDCVRVDGSSGPCGSGGGLVPQFADGETPAGVIDGSNTSFLLNFAPTPAASLELYRNGLLLKPGVDFGLSVRTVTFFVASTPQAGDLLQANYRFGDPTNPLGSLTSSQVVCSGVGGSTSATASTQLGSCTLPAGLIGAGDRIEVRFQYAHVGASVGFTGEVRFGGATLVSRAAGSGETAFVGRIELGVYAGGQAWNLESWGSGLSLATGAGVAGQDTSQAVTISLRGQMASGTTDSLVLRNFTVVRFPAQTNP